MQRSASPATAVDETIYPSADGRPLAETGTHCRNFVALLDILDRHGEYEPLNEINGRLPSEVLGLHFEADGDDLRVYDPAAGRRLPTSAELLSDAAAENKRLRRELAKLKQRPEQAGH